MPGSSLTHEFQLPVVESSEPWVYDVALVYEDTPPETWEYRAFLTESMIGNNPHPFVPAQQDFVIDVDILNLP